MSLPRPEANTTHWISAGSIYDMWWYKGSLSSCGKDMVNTYLAYAEEPLFQYLGVNS